MYDVEENVFESQMNLTRSSLRVELNGESNELTS
jgi:hypothetical protein